MPQDKVVSIEDAVKQIKSGDVIMIGGFAATGTPVSVINEIAKHKFENLTLVCNDTGTPERGVGKLIPNKIFTKAIVSHIGFNPETVRQYESGELDVELTPQGSLVERIRCAGFGLGGLLTPTGLGTEVAEGKEVITVDNKEFLLEKPIYADVAIVRVRKADKIGNVVFHGSNISHSMMMMTAAKVTIVEADEIVEVGTFDPDFVHMPSVFTTYVVQGEGINE